MSNDAQDFLAKNIELRLLDDEMPVIRRIRELSTQQYFTSWMQLEIAALSRLLELGSITADALWQLVLSRHGIAPGVRYDDVEDSPNGQKPLTECQLVWAHLTALCQDQELEPVPPLPTPYSVVTEAMAVVREQALDFCVHGINLLYERFGPNEQGILDRLARDPRHDIEYYLAAQWLGGLYAVGATLHGRGSFGLEDQPVYALKALVEALKRSIADYKEVRAAGADAALGNELFGRVRFWWMVTKGYTYDMLNTQRGQNVVAMLLKHPKLVADLEEALKDGLDVGDVNASTSMIPQWGNPIDRALNRTIALTSMRVLLDQLTAQLASALKEINQIPRR